MDYVFIFGFQIFGVAFHIGQVILNLDRVHEEKPMKDIIALFFDNEWASLSVSTVIIFFHLFVEAFFDYYDFGFAKESFTFPFTSVQVPFIFVSAAVALVFGYGGQRLAYKYLGKAEQYLSSKAD